MRRSRQFLLLLAVLGGLASGPPLRAASGFVAALVGILHLRKHRHLRLRIDAGRLRLSIDDASLGELSNPRDGIGDKRTAIAGR